MKQRARRYDFFADIEVASTPVGFLPRRVQGVFIHKYGIAGYAIGEQITFFGTELGALEMISHIAYPMDHNDFDAIFGRWIETCIERRCIFAA